MALMHSHGLCVDAQDKLLLAREVLTSAYLGDTDAYALGTTLMNMLMRKSTTQTADAGAVEAEVLAALGHPTLGLGAASQLLYEQNGKKTPEWTDDATWQSIREYAQLIANR